jgi:hypothetical protein
VPGGFCLGLALLFLIGNLSIYNEAIIWGLAWSIAALYFAFRTQSGTAIGSTRVLLGFSICAACALLSRATFGAPFLLIATLLAVRVGSNERLRQLPALFLPLAAGVAFFLLLSYAKFGTLTGEGYEHYINSVHREFALKHGVFDLRRVPLSLADYFSFRAPAIESHPPFLKVDRHSYSYPSLYSLQFSETFLPVTSCSPWLVFGACIGIVYLFRKNRTNLFDRGIAAALFAQFICILSFFALAQRYAADLYPFLIFCFAIFLRASPFAWQRMIMAGLTAVSIVVNFLATASWIGSDENLPAETRIFWNAVVGKTAAGSVQQK